eukprot:8950388-Pyramimonas_sp.AAC.1
MAGAASAMTNPTLPAAQLEPRVSRCPSTTLARRRPRASWRCSDPALTCRRRARRCCTAGEASS